MNQRLGGTRAGLALVSTLVLALALTLADAALLVSLSLSQRSDVAALLTAQADVVAAGVEDANGVVTIGADAPGQSPEGIAVDSALVSTSSVLAESAGQSLTKATLLAIANQALTSGGLLTDASDPRGVPHRVYAKVLDPGRVLVVSRSIAELNAGLQRTAVLLGIASLGLVAVAGAVSYWMAGRALRGVRESFESLRRFTADASHELRAPLALLRNELDVTLERDRTLPEYQRALTGMRSEVEHLSRLTDHLLLLARADAKALVPTREAIDVADALHETAARWSRAASDCGLTIAVNSPESGIVHAELPLLRRVIDNLMDNAIRHSPRGGEVMISGTHGVGGWWIAVSDQGPGVAEEHRARLFTRFARPDAARSRDVGGAGLGLALSAAIVRAHGGRLELASAPGTGATFRAFLPDL